MLLKIGTLAIIFIIILACFYNITLSNISFLDINKKLNYQIEPKNKIRQKRYVLIFVEAHVCPKKLIL